MPVPENPDVSTPEEWTDPTSQQLTWTLDRTCNIVGGANIRNAADYPFPPPYPGLDSVGHTFSPGGMSMLTTHQVRGRDLINEPRTVGRELCRRHRGYMTIRNGRMCPVFISVPNRLTRLGYVSVGKMMVRTTSPRADTDLLSTVSPGRMCAVASLQLPEHVEVVYDSTPHRCTPIS